MHQTTIRFWRCFEKLPTPIKRLAEQNFQLLKSNPTHPSLHFKKTGKFWSARVGLTHRVLAIKDGENYIWVWIGDHNEYERLINRRS